MWHTSQGDRTLQGAEAALVAAAVTGIVEHIREESSGLDEPWEYGIELFDSLTWTQRVVLLDLVATHLLTQTKQTLELSAVAEATVAAIFAHVLVEIDFEIDEQRGTRWRQMVLDAYRETEPAEEGEPVDGFVWNPPKANSCDLSEWNQLVEGLLDEILWDRDFQMMGLLADQPPEVAEGLRLLLGIDSDFFVTAGPDTDSNRTIAIAFNRLARFSR